MEVDEYNQRLLESFQIMNAVNSQPDLAQFVYPETRTPRGIQNFYDLLLPSGTKEYWSFGTSNTKTRASPPEKSIHWHSKNPKTVGILLPWTPKMRS
jgi:hypothetical protein